ncbi:hypothetical protein HQ531_13770, partial [bacterium]|nr:hypothetical protein [bacterium]
MIVAFRITLILLTISVLNFCSEDKPPTKPDIENEPLEESVTETINALNGGTVELTEGAILEIPPGALSENTEITIATITPNFGSTENMEAGIQQTGYSISQIVVCKPDSMEFATPVTIRIPIIEDRLLDGIDLGDLKIITWHEDKWDTLSTIIDIENKMAVAEVSHFSEFRVTSSGGEITIFNPTLGYVGSSNSVTLLFNSTGVTGGILQGLIRQFSQIPWGEIWYDVKLYKYDFWGSELIQTKQLYKLGIYDQIATDITFGEHTLDNSFYEYNDFARHSQAGWHPYAELMQYRDLFDFSSAGSATNSWEGAIIEVDFNTSGSVSNIEFHNYGSDDLIPMGNAEFLKSFSLGSDLHPVEIISLDDLEEGEEYFFEIEAWFPIIGNASGQATTSKFTTDDIGDIIAMNEGPNVIITTPQYGEFSDYGTPLTFSGIGNDPEDGSISGNSLQWYSNMDGDFGTGTSVTVSDLSINDHRIYLFGYDDIGQSGYDFIDITIENNDPLASIIAPSPNSSFPGGSNVTFTGSSTDVEDGTLTGNSLLWTSNLDGQIGTGSSFTISTLSIGNHSISLVATDSHGASSSPATRNISITNAPPQVTINLPADGYTTEVGTLLAFNASAYDPQDGNLGSSQIDWSSNRDGHFQTGRSFNYSGLSANTHTITVTATDLNGAFGGASITLNITAAGNTPPQIVSLISNPTSIEPNGTTTVTCFASDADGDALSYNWAASNGNISGSGSTVTFIAPNTEGNYTVSCTVSDGNGGQDNEAVIISVTELNTPPIASLNVDPSSGTTATNFMFDASSCSDNEDATSQLEIRWDFQSDGSWDIEYSTIKTASYLFTIAGSYTITIEVKD